MTFTFPSFSLNAEVLKKSDSPEFLFLLHGFTGSLNEWQEISYGLSDNINIVGIDLMGHGKSDSPDDISLYSSAAIVSQLYYLINQFTKDKIILLGYSMGGRAALSFAFHFPSLLKGLILESSSPGLKTEIEKQERIVKDEKLAEFISNHTLDEFVSYWMNLDIFNTQRRFSDKKRQEIKAAKLLNNKQGLINSLKGFGTGVMPSLWNNLNDINIKTLLITGELDTKFSEINSEMASLLPYSQRVIIPAAGHNTHLEEPKKFISVVNEFLSSF